MDLTPETRYSLIAKLHDPTDMQAWDEFAQLYQPLIFRIVTNRGLQYADAKDVSQEVMSRVSKAIDRWDPNHEKSTFRGWLYRITRNLTIDFLRQTQNAKWQAIKMERHFDIEQLADPASHESAEFYLQYERQLFALVAQQVRTQVQERTWLAFWQSEVLGKPVSEVSRNLKMTAGAVYVSRSRVMARMKKEIQLRLDETNAEF